MEVVTRKMEGVRNAVSNFVNEKTLLQTLCLFSLNMLLNSLQVEMDMEEGSVRYEAYNAVRLQLQDSVQRTKF